MNDRNDDLSALRRCITEAAAGAFPEKADALVFGEGPMRPKLMLIGEAPGEQETLQKRPFVGKAGKNLDEFLALAGLRREEIYIGNTVKFRPTREGKSGRLSNRPPNRMELEFFRPYLLEELELVRPFAVATLGNVPLQAIAGPKITVGEAHGKWFPNENGLRLFPLYHPAAVIYNRALSSVYQEDVRRLASELSTVETSGGGF